MTQEKKKQTLTGWWQTDTGSSPSSATCYLRQVTEVQITSASFFASYKTLAHSRCLLYLFHPSVAFLRQFTKKSLHSWHTWSQVENLASKHQLDFSHLIEQGWFPLIFNICKI